MGTEKRWIVSREKVLNYLLCETHPEGRGKAVFFEALGYARDDWEVLARDLVDSARKGEKVHRVATPFGFKLVILGKLSTPRSKQIVVRTVWMGVPEVNAWRLVTAYPVRSEDDL